MFLTFISLFINFVTVEINKSDQNNFECTTLENEKKRLMEYIPLDYKIKVANMAKAHPKWNLATLHKKGGARLKSIKHLYRREEDIKKEIIGAAEIFRTQTMALIPNYMTRILLSILIKQNVSITINI